MQIAENRSLMEKLSVQGENPLGIELVVSDLDGTLLNPEHVLSTKTIQTVRLLVEGGCQFMLATGRHYQDVYLLARQIGVDMCLITSNGGRVHNQAGELLYENHMPAELVKRVLELSDDFQVHRNLYQQDLWLVEEPHEQLLAIHHSSGFEYQFRNFSEMSLEHIDKIYFTADHEVLVALETVLKQNLDGLLNITFTSPEYLEVMNLGVSKGQAMQMIMQQLGLHPDQVVALGDGMNDREMLSVVGHGVVMENASTELKKVLPDLNRAKSNSEDGVADYLQQLKLV